MWLLQNWRKGHSRLSLNEAAFIIDGPPPAEASQQVPAALHQHHLQHHHHHLQHLRHQQQQHHQKQQQQHLQHHLPMPTNTFVAPMPPQSLKQFKKWQKKQKKLLKKIGQSGTPAYMPNVPLPYARAFSVDNLTSQMLDGYADVAANSKRSWKDKKNMRKSEIFTDLPPMVPPGPPRSTISSGCSNGFTISDLRISNSAPSTNTSDRSHLTLATERSCHHHMQKPSPGHIKVSTEQFGNGGAIRQQHPQHYRRHLASTDAIGDEVKQQGCHSRFENGPPNRIPNATSSTQACSNSSSSSNNNQAVTSKSVVTCTDFGATVAPSNSSGVEVGSSKSSMNGEALDDSMTERRVLTKITPEAKKILEQNSKLFGKHDDSSSCDPKVDACETGEFNLSTQHSDSMPLTPNHSSHSVSVSCVSLKKNVDYGSTISSLTQSTNMRTDISDIDFSWVNDVENRLDKEIAFVREDLPRQQQQQHQQQQQLPVRYFGIDSVSQQTVSKRLTAPRMFTEPMVTKQMEVFGECDARKELSQIHSDVKSKAAMFDCEASMNEKRSAENAIAYRYRSRSTPRTNVYIPHPDYQSYDPLSVDTSQSSEASDGAKGRVGETEVEVRCRGSNAFNDGNSSDIKLMQSTAAGATDNNILQRNRTYNATEYYIQNASSKRDIDKPWRASVAY